MYRLWEQGIDIKAFLSPCIHSLEVWKDGMDFTKKVPWAYLKDFWSDSCEIDVLGWATEQLEYQ